MVAELDVKEKVYCYRLQSEGVWLITAMTDRKRDIVFFSLMS